MRLFELGEAQLEFGELAFEALGLFARLLQAQLAVVAEARERRARTAEHATVEFAFEEFADGAARRGGAQRFERSEGRHARVDVVIFEQLGEAALYLLAGGQLGQRRDGRAARAERFAVARPLDEARRGVFVAGAREPVECSGSDHFGPRGAIELFREQLACIGVRRLTEGARSGRGHEVAVVVEQLHERLVGRLLAEAPERSRHRAAHLGVGGAASREQRFEALVTE